MLESYKPAQLQQGGLFHRVWASQGCMHCQILPNVRRPCHWAIDLLCSGALLHACCHRTQAWPDGWRGNFLVGSPFKVPRQSLTRCVRVGTQIAHRQTSRRYNCWRRYCITTTTSSIQVAPRVLQLHATPEAATATAGPGTSMPTPTTSAPVTKTPPPSTSGQGGVCFWFFNTCILSDG